MDAPNVCLSFVLLFTIFIIVVTQKLVFQKSKNVTAKCTETLLPPPCIQYSLLYCSLLYSRLVYVLYGGLFGGYNDL